MSNFLAIDQGTTSSRAIVFDDKLNVVIDSQKEYKLSYPNDGWVEADPADILNTVKETVSNVLKNDDSITACGITNQRESTIVWSRETGEPIYPAIIWQDRRTHQFCKELRDSGHEKMVREKTGLVIDPYFSATKIKWILDNVVGARELADNGKLMFGTVDSFLIYSLTKESERRTELGDALSLRAAALSKVGPSLDSRKAAANPRRTLPSSADAVPEVGPGTRNTDCSSSTSRSRGRAAAE